MVDYAAQSQPAKPTQGSTASTLTLGETKKNKNKKGHHPNTPPLWETSRAQHCQAKRYAWAMENMTVQKLLAAYAKGERNFSGADLKGVNLSEANLSGAYLSNANLNCAWLSGANLSGANLSGADLRHAELSNANLSGANLSKARLSKANLIGANLDGANLSGVNFMEPTEPTFMEPNRDAAEEGDAEEEG